MRPRHDSSPIAAARLRRALPGRCAAAAAARPRAAGPAASRVQAAQRPASRTSSGSTRPGIMARQSRVEADIHECMKAQGFDYVPIDPFAQRAARHRSQPPQRRGLPEAVRLRDQHALGPRRRRRATPTSGCARASARRTGAPTTARCGARTRARRSRPRSTAATSPSSAGCTRKATESVFGGAQVLTQLQGKLDQLDERILADQRMVRALGTLDVVHGRGRLPLRGPRRDRQRPHQAHGEDRRPRPRPVRDRSRLGPEARALRPRGARRAPARGGRDRRAPTSPASARTSRPVEAVVRPQYEAQFRQRNQTLISQVKPVR